MIDTYNKYGVSIASGGQDQPEQVMLMFPVQALMAKEEALMFAAWIVTLAETDIPFEEYLVAIANA